MALTRKFLTALGIESEKVDEIIDAHVATVDALKEQIAQAKDDVDELAKAKAKIEELTKQIDENKSDEVFKVKYEALKEEFKSYKSDIEAKATRETKVNAYRKLLESAGVSEKRIDSIIKVSGDVVDGIKFDAENNVVGADELTEGIKTEWADFIVTEGIKGADVAKPPKVVDGKKSKEDILAIKDTTERQRAIAENLDLFN